MTLADGQGCRKTARTPPPSCPALDAAPSARLPAATPPPVSPQTRPPPSPSESWPGPERVRVEALGRNLNRAAGPTTAAGRAASESVLQSSVAGPLETGRVGPPPADPSDPSAGLSSVTADPAPEPRTAGVGVPLLLLLLPPPLPLPPSLLLLPPPTPCRRAGPAGWLKPSWASTRMMDGGLPACRRRSLRKTGGWGDGGGGGVSASRGGTVGTATRNALLPRRWGLQPALHCRRRSRAAPPSPRSTLMLPTKEAPLPSTPPPMHSQ
jgi:hypothetical protein